MDVSGNAASEVIDHAYRSSPPGIAYPQQDSVSVLEEFPEPVELQSTFHRIWGSLEEHLALSLTSEEALRLFRSLVIYDMPDGTRSTLTVDPQIDAGTDAALYCVALIHVLRALGAPSCIIMTHTSYNRERGKEGLDRILKIIMRGSKPLKQYADGNDVAVHWIGMVPGYELYDHLTTNFQPPKNPSFDAYFLVDYAEDLVTHPDVGSLLQELPEVHVCVRHTKFNMSGGWIPGKLLKAAFVYSQNGTLYSNWTFEELVSLSTVSLLASLFQSGEGLAKMYGDIDEVKARYQMRELRLHNQLIRLSARPKKLFLLGSPLGVHQVYF